VKGYNFLYFLREGIKGILQHGFTSFAAVGAIVACLIIMGSFALLSFNVNEVIQKVEDDNQILVFIDDSLSENEALAVGTKIYAVENVKTAQFTSRDEAFAQYHESLGDDGYLLDGLESEDILRHRYRIYVEDINLMEQTCAELKKISGIDKVSASFEISEGIITLKNTVNIITYILAAVLAAVSVFIISNTVKLATFDRREEIAIMKMVGATNSFIRWPFVFEGFLLGLIGGLIAFFGQWGIYNFAAENIPALTQMGALVSFYDISAMLLLVFMGVGFLVGIGGSVTTIRKFMRV
jgi:cell division transport system permease protein